MPYHLLAFLLAAGVVLGVTPWVKRWGLQVGSVDLPNERKIHRQPMVRIGGVAIFVGYVLALLVVWWAGGFVDAQGQPLRAQADAQIWATTVGGLGFFLIGLVDDLFSLSPGVRLVLQMVVAGAVWAWGVRIDFVTLPGLGLVSVGSWSLPLTLLWLVGMANAINMVDGVDGLAAGVSGIAAVVLLVVTQFLGQPAAALLAAALAGACLGFLRYNFNPAQIFMGDGGAYFMGFTLAAMGVIGLVKRVTTAAVVLPYIILAVPLLDMTWVVIDRLRRGKSPFFPDQRHLHHRLLRAGLSQRETVTVIYSLTLWAGSVALALAELPGSVVYVTVATLLLGFVGWRVWQQRRS
ncbi:MAG: MraY family glycosyltransferase [Gloeomargarita sp. GXS_bins_116]